jgi:hypothetical protein
MLPRERSRAGGLGGRGGEGTPFPNPWGGPRTRLLLVAHLGGAEGRAAAEEVAGGPAALVAMADLVGIAVVVAPNGRGAPALNVHESARHVNCGGGKRQACEGLDADFEGLTDL